MTAAPGGPAPVAGGPAQRACGTWPSPLDPAALAAAATDLSTLAAAPGGRLRWLESRPQEGGRSVLVERAPDGRLHEPLPAGADVRSRVHEYGGTAWTAAGVAGQTLLWCERADQRVRVRRADGRVALLTPPGTRHADFDAAPDGRHVVAVREDHRTPDAAGHPRNLLVRLDLHAGVSAATVADAPADAHPDTSAQADADADADAATVLWSGSDFVAWPRLDATGTRLAWVSWNHPAMPWDATTLHVATLGADGVLRDETIVAGGPDAPAESLAEPSWCADGSLLFIGDRSGTASLLRWQPQAPQAVETVFAPPTGECGAPLWNLGLRSFAVAPDGRVLLRSDAGGRQTLWLLAPGEAPRPLALPAVAFGSSLAWRDDGRACAIAAPVDAPPALIAFTPPPAGAPADDLAVDVLRDGGPPPLPRAQVSVPQAIEFPTAPAEDGRARTAHAWFHPPLHPDCVPLPGEKPPLVVLLHGGPTAVSSPAFKTGVQFWTTRGFAVVHVNYGGSTGFGRAYRERLLGRWGVVDLQDAVAAVDFLAAAGQVDGARAVIRGGSAGGFTVLSALAFTRRFAAGINYYGVADLRTLAADTHKFEARYLDSLVAPLTQGADVYRSRSPALHMARCRAALLTLQGGEDRAVPPSQSRAVVAAARAAGCPVAYLEFPGEGHGFRGAEVIVRAAQAELVFLARVLGFPVDPALPALAIHNEDALGAGRAAADG